jgi:hypothetical protein
MEIGNLSKQFPKESVTVNKNSFVTKIKGTNDSGEFISVFVDKIEYVEIFSDSVSIKINNKTFLKFKLKNELKTEDAHTEFKY